MTNSNKWEDRVKASSAFYSQLVTKDMSKELYALLAPSAVSGPSVANLVYNIVLGAVYCVPLVGNFIAFGMSSIWSVLLGGGEQAAVRHL
ncbi:hypothetical protein SAMD00019534_070630 [Acytostelium subglobosum LB1]|uniref:hypothetical protein n=1 Tax=Acytostelium subglobosum LB1 TaxID=1410327 RepID=UPI000644882D|nr:hypothetical protein SAMD00019534_070630 [Acytostelium subglobosum LB1]GAM23888.1 hypothetical protein SAMD00019534_070630 [Acytostelium subglobosum LB1]|eukprot:XP_012752924.1 hypothetical protein SAMD00019534_070630 [Acytostelium subglobosum LB1]